MTIKFRLNLIKPTSALRVRYCFFQSCANETIITSIQVPSEISTGGNRDAVVGILYMLTKQMNLLGITCDQ